MSGTRDFNNIETRAVIKFFFLQGKTPKEIHAIVTETLACFLPGRAKNLAAPLYLAWYYIQTWTLANVFILCQLRSQQFLNFTIVTFLTFYYCKTKNVKFVLALLFCLKFPEEGA
jgi:hypothetical protein